jgi:pyridoxine kinase
MAKAQGAVVAISSHVARGSVGNRAMVFALERLGFEVWAVPTVTLPHHPGHGPAERIVAEPAAFAALLETLVQEGRAAQVAGIVSGYLASPEQARAVAALVRRVKQARPDTVYLCDPVIGDAGRLYVPTELAEAIRDDLLPLADAATPNAFECDWLSGTGDSGTELAAIAGRLAPPTVLVTSAPALMRRQIGNLLVSPEETLLLEHPLLSTPVKGTGDLLAALFLARRLEGRGDAKSAEMAVASTLEVVAATARAGGDELMVAEFQASIVQPRATVNVRRMSRNAPTGA